MYLLVPRKEIDMGLDAEGDAAVADEITHRLDPLSASDVPLRALRRVLIPSVGQREPSPEAATKLQPLVPAPATPPSRIDGASPSPFVLTATHSAPQILRYAETLGIPWKQILVEEIAAEERLRRYIEDVENKCPLRSAVKLLSSCFLRSWRIRKQIESLSLAARSASMREAVRQLRAVFSELMGRNEKDKTALALHLWFAYQRILLLQRVRRAASRSRGEVSERLASICTAARCSYDDAAWAILEEGSPRRGNRLDAAVRKVREEGFRIPQAATEARSFAQLRRIVRASPHVSGARRSRGIAADPSLALSSTRRVPFPVDAV
jgi:hypothetical protein